MKTFQVEIKTEKIEVRSMEIVNTSHDIPVWMYSPIRNYHHNSDKVTSIQLANCSLCDKPLSAISIPSDFGRPDFVELNTCTVVQTEDGRRHPMHKHCYDTKL